MKTVAFVPIRLNSQRVEGKNLRLLGNKPLMTYLLESLVAARNIDEVYVYCSDESVKQYIPEGAKFLKRDSRLDSNTTLGEEIYTAFTAGRQRHAVHALGEGNKGNLDAVYLPEGVAFG